MGKGTTQISPERKGEPMQIARRILARKKSVPEEIMGGGEKAVSLACVKSEESFTRKARKRKKILKRVNRGRAKAWGMEAFWGFETPNYGGKDMRKHNPMAGENYSISRNVEGDKYHRRD